VCGTRSMTPCWSLLRRLVAPYMGVFSRLWWRSFCAILMGLPVYHVRLEQTAHTTSPFWTCCLLEGERGGRLSLTSEHAAFGPDRLAAKLLADAGADAYARHDIKGTAAASYSWSQPWRFRGFSRAGSEMRTALLCGARAVMVLRLRPASARRESAAFGRAGSAVYASRFTTVRVLVTRAVACEAEALVGHAGRALMACRDERKVAAVCALPEGAPVIAGYLLPQRIDLQLQDGQSDWCSTA